MKFRPAMPRHLLCALVGSFALLLPVVSTAQASAATTAGGSSASAILQARSDSARYPYTPADIAFMSGMIGHHAQAIVMAEMAPTHGANAEVTTLASRIINSQRDEIAIMARWLRDRLQPVPDTTGRSMTMMDGHMMHTAGGDGAMSGAMPGMLTAAQLTALDEAKGSAFDNLFLTGMIQHHSGAVSMVQKLFATDGAAQDETVFKFATDVNVDQSTEIARMQRMLFMLKLEGKVP
jgi:uncharacterized protein (DUF305 family)